MLMTLKNTPNRWGLVSQWFHWLTALLILATLLLGWVAVRLPISPQKIDLFVLHKSMGLLTLGAVILRWLWLMVSPSPKAASGFSSRHWRNAKIVHSILYLGLILVPLSGWFLNSAAKIPLIWFFTWPSIPDWPVPESWQGALSFLHVYGFYSFLLLISLHIFFACWHHFHGSELLRRLLPYSRLSRAILALLPIVMITTAGVYYSRHLPDSPNIDQAGSVQHADDQTVAEPSAVQSTLASAVHIPQERSLLPFWVSVAEQSELTFEGTYEGSPFSGAFNTFSAEMAFDENRLDQSYVKANINTRSVTTFNQDWDSSLPEEDWFASELFPKAQFIAKGFDLDSGQIESEGVLTLKGIQKPIKFTFEWQTENEGMSRLIGTASINRTDFNIGSGYWLEDDSIGFTVKVKVDVVFRPVLSE